VRRLVHGFSEAKKAAVRSLGFGSWLDIAGGKFNHVLCRFMLNNITVPSFVFELNGRSVVITPEQVGFILGLRNSGPPVSDSSVFEDIEPLCKRHGFVGAELVRLGNIEDALAALDAVVDGGFKEKLVLFLLATVFSPTTSLNIPRTYLHVVKDIDRVSEYNWALFVFNKLRDAVLAFKLQPSKTYICGCVYFLQV
jgi:hypothetical protein